VHGTHVQWQAPPSVMQNLVLVHGGGGRALDMLSTPDGRPGWATLFLRDGFALRLADLGIHGNGHAMMLEKNNAEIAAVITDWIIKHT
jgi:hypothetical protein